MLVCRYVVVIMQSVWALNDFQIVGSFLWGLMTMKFWKDVLNSAFVGGTPHFACVAVLFFFSELGCGGWLFARSLGLVWPVVQCELLLWLASKTLLGCYVRASAPF